MVANRLRIFVADDHAIVRQGLRLLIDSQADMTVVGEAPDGRILLQQVASAEPDVVVVDVSMPEMSGLTATRTLKQRFPAIKVVALTRHEEQMFVEEFLRAGASAYVLKHSDPTEFLRAIRAAAAGGVYIDPAVTGRVADGLLAGKPQIQRDTSNAISEREAEVLRLVAIGHSNQEIADRLNISIKTVETHKSNAMRKLGLTGRVDVIRYGVMKGWLYDT